MVNTLRITSVIAVVLAISLISFSAVHGFKKNPEVDELLGTPTVKERADQNKGARVKAPDAKQSPLVIQAGKFALHLNPPPPPPVGRPDNSRAGDRVDREPVRPPAKFSVTGISYSPTDPNLSRALIDEPGDGMRWVRLQDKIGHHTVQAINENGIVLSNNQEVTKMARHKVSLVVKEGEVRATPRPSPSSSTMARTQPRISVKGSKDVLFNAPQPLAHRPVPSVSRSAATKPRVGLPPMDAKDTAEMQRIVDQIRQQNAKGGDLTEEDKAKRKQILDRLTSRMRASRLNPSGIREPDPND